MKMVQWAAEGLNSQFRKADSRVWCMVCNLQSSAVTGGCIAFYKDGGW